MALVTVKVQGSDGEEQEVLLDTITGQTFAMPIYKLAIGAVGINDGVISLGNPLPVTEIIDGESIGLGNPLPIGGNELHALGLKLDKLSRLLELVIRHLVEIDENEFIVPEAINLTHDL